MTTRRESDRRGAGGNITPKTATTSKTSARSAEGSTNNSVASPSFSRAKIYSSPSTANGKEEEGATKTATASSTQNHPSQHHDTNTTASATASMMTLWQTLDRQLRVNIGTSVKCGICLSTMTNPVRTPCVHSFCEDCILASLLCSKSCPECKATLSKRQLQPFQYLHDMANAYKDLLKEFGFAPGKFDATFTTLTQKAGSCDDDDDDDDDENKKGSALPQLDRLLVAKTWQQHSLPQCHGVSKMQLQENDQVVHANLEACDKIDLPSHLSGNAKEDFGNGIGDGAAALRKGVGLDECSTKHLSSFPRTQDVEDQEREQLAADKELEDSLNEDDCSNQGIDGEQSHLCDGSVARSSTGGDGISVSGKTTVCESGTETTSECNEEQRESTCPTSVMDYVNENVDSAHTDEMEMESLVAHPNAAEPSPLCRDEGAKNNAMEVEAFNYGEPTQRFMDDQEAREKPPKGPGDKHIPCASSDPLAVATVQITKPQTSCNEALESNIKGSNQNCPKPTIASALPDNIGKGETDEILESKKTPPGELQDKDILLASTNAFKVGSIVDVEARTWPGVNKHGGIGRVMKANADGTFNIAYVLGGKELNVESAFISRAEKMENPNLEGSDQNCTKPTLASASPDNIGKGETDKIVESKKTPPGELQDKDISLASTNAFKVGSIVDVEARTWPGVNKHGGIGRVTKVNADGTFNIAYVLGGKELNVESAFISRAEKMENLSEKDQPTTTRRKRRPVDGLPEELLRQLEMEGFDVGKNVQALNSGPKRRDAEGQNPLFDSTNGRQTKRKKTRREPKKSSFASKATNARTDTAMGDSANATVLNDAFQGEDTKSTGSISDSSSYMESKEEVIRIADAIYQKRFQRDLDKKLVVIAASGLSDSDAAALKLLCATTFKDNVRMKTTESVDYNTTMCIVSSNRTDGDNVEASIRSFKAMKASLEGVPMTTPEWIQECIKDGEIMCPTTFVRSLPTKSESIAGTKESNFGVARMTVLRNRSNGNLFGKIYALLAGSYPKTTRVSLTKLLLSGGAIILSSPSATLSKFNELEEMKNSQWAKIVVVCGKNSEIDLPKKLLEKRSSATTGAVQVVEIVGQEWIAESITCARAMPATLFDLFKKKAGQTKK